VWRFIAAFDFHVVDPSRQLPPVFAGSKLESGDESSHSKFRKILSGVPGLEGELRLSKQQTY